MRDQVQGLVALGIPTATLHSAAEPHETAEVLARLGSGSLKLLYVAPERLDQPAMIAALRAAHRQMMAIDEAHCIPHWGHEFRPEYRGLRKAADAIGVRQIVAVTATAAPPTRTKIIANLFASPPRVFSGSFERPNLSHRVERRGAGLRQIQQFLAEHAGQSGIVYCATREKTDQLARQLRAAGFSALAYHAAHDGGTRHAHQDEFISDKGVVMVATIASAWASTKPTCASSAMPIFRRHLRHTIRRPAVPAATVCRQTRFSSMRRKILTRAGCSSRASPIPTASMRRQRSWRFWKNSAARRHADSRCFCTHSTTRDARVAGATIAARDFCDCDARRDCRRQAPLILQTARRGLSTPSLMRARRRRMSPRRPTLPRRLLRTFPRSACRH